MANQYTKTDVDVEQVKKLYLSGMTQSEIAEHLGITQKIVWHRLRELNVKCRVAAKRNQVGKSNGSWKGDKATYAAFHYRIYALRGKPRKCEVCGTDDPKKTYDWANLTGQYDNPNDYRRMCRSCHWKRDGKINNIHMGKGKADAAKT